MTVIIVDNKGKLVKTWGTMAFVKAMGGGFINDCVAKYNKMNHLHKAVRI